MTATPATLEPRSSEVWTESLHTWEGKEPRPCQEWCDDTLYISKRMGAYLAGPWDTWKFPYERGVMWAWEHAHVQTISLMWATQLGKTIIGSALLAWSHHNEPANSVMACPIVTSARKHSQEKLQLMLEHVDAGLPRDQRLLLPNKHDRQDLMIDLCESVCHYAWAGSDVGTGEVSGRYLVITELDKWAQYRGSEGDPWSSIKSRVKGWPNHKILEESTPTLYGTSRIQSAMDNAELRCGYHVPCPHCDEFQTLTFENVRWDKDADGHSTAAMARATALYFCAHCGAAIPDHHKGEMLRKGVWAGEDVRVPKGTTNELPFFFVDGKVPRSVGLQLASWYSPLLTWGDCAATFVDRKKSGDIQNWRNEWEGRPYRPPTSVPKWGDIKRRLAVGTPRSIVPDWAIGLTAGIDCHDPGGKGAQAHYATVRAWGYDGKSQLVECKKTHVPSANFLVQTKIVVDGLLGRAYSTESGGSMKIGMTCVDSGYNPESVYQSVDPYGIGLARATKGATSTTGAPLIWQARERQVNPATGKRAGGLYLFTVNSDELRSYVNSKLNTQPGDINAWLLHVDPPDDYLKQITNVARVLKRVSGKTKYEWETLEGVDDHYHDAECLAAAAAEMKGWRNLATVKKKSGDGYHEAKGSAKQIDGWKIGR